MQNMTGSPKQIAYAESIRRNLILKFEAGIAGLQSLGCDVNLILKAKIVKNEALKNTHSEDWIKYQNGQMYKLAERVGNIGALEIRLGWSKEETKAIGYGIFDRICEYAICATEAFNGNN